MPPGLGPNAKLYGYQCVSCKEKMLLQKEAQPVLRLV